MGLSDFFRLTTESLADMPSKIQGVGGAMFGGFKAFNDMVRRT